MRVHVVADPEGEFGRTLRAALARKNDSREEPALEITALEITALEITALEITVATEAESAAFVTDAVKVLVSGRPSEALLDAATSLEWVVVPFAGIPRVTAERLATRAQLSLTNLHHNAVATAEHAIALLLAATRRLIPADRALRAHDWSIRYDDDPSLIAAGKRALILGVGAIGGRVARVLSALEVEVRGIVRDPAGHALANEISLLPVTELDSALEEADLLICTLPETEETRGLLDARRLALLPNGAVVVNVGRGAVIDEEALFRALEGGSIAAAGIDVWYQYPEGEEARTDTAPSEYPFAELENVVLSPHRAGHGRGIEELRAEHLLQALDEISRGERNGIDRARGY